MAKSDTARLEDYKGIKWGSAFFGWLVAVGVGSILTGIVTAIITAVSINMPGGSFISTLESLSFWGILLMLAIVAIAYYSGGYVAGRMSRLDGSRQGLGVWVWGIILAVVLGLLGYLLGSSAGLLQQLSIPYVIGNIRTAAGIIGLIVAAVVALIAAMGGGQQGERYHRRVDQAVIGAATSRANPTTPAAAGTATQNQPTADTGQAPQGPGYSRAGSQSPTFGERVERRGSAGGRRADDHRPR